MKSQIFIKSRIYPQPKSFFAYTNLINDCNTSLGKDAIHRVSTNGLFVAFFFQIGINYQLRITILVATIVRRYHSQYGLWYRRRIELIFPSVLWQHLTGVRLLAKSRHHENGGRPCGQGDGF